MKVSSYCDVFLTHLQPKGAAKGTGGSAGTISEPGHCEPVIGQVAAYMEGAGSRGSAVGMAPGY
jgi:hypothetical protein